jgi:hypothetical protein
MRRKIEFIQGAAKDSFASRVAAQPAGPGRLLRGAALFVVHLE